MPWLVRLRWASVIALAAAAWAAYIFWRVRLPILPLAALLAALAATNAALAFQLRSPAPRRAVVGGVLLIDVGLLTGILYLVGGPINPFSIVYLVGITVAAVALGYRWAIALGLLSNAAYGLTFFYHRPLEFIDPSGSSAVLTLHLSGMWVAFAAATGLIAYFVGRVSEALAQRERELTEARASVAKNERLAALFALGAGAAHELATPLSTIRPVLQQLDAVLVVVDRVEIGAAARKEQLVVPIAAVGPHTRRVAQRVRHVVHVAAIELVTFDDRDAAGRRRALRLDVGLHPLAGDEDTLLQRLHGEAEIRHGRP
jgi:two-component system sensor histidine kinase RegB